MKKIILLILMFIALAAGGVYWMKAGNPNALRHIVLDQCLPNQTAAPESGALRAGET